MKIRTLDISELNDRLSELEGLRDALDDAKYELRENTDESEEENLKAAIDSASDDFGEDEAKELKQLESLRDDIGSRGSAISEDGGPFVHENDFKEYAMELADDIGAIPSGASWPCTCIDWDQAASELQMDYSAVEWEGVSYYYRS